MPVDLWANLTASLWAGLFSASIGAVLTAPRRSAWPTFLCGFAGRCVRGGLVSWGWTQSWATVAAAAMVVLVAAALTRRRQVSPVILVSSVLPLGAALAMFKAIMALLRMPSLEGDALANTAVLLSASVGTVFTTSLAIALGLGGGLAIVRAAAPERTRDPDAPGR